METITSDKLLMMSEFNFKSIIGHQIRLVLSDSILEGVLSGIVLSSNPNPQTNEHIPVSFLLNDVSVSIFNVKELIVVK